jgi:hypothetical protein
MHTIWLRSLESQLGHFTLVLIKQKSVKQAWHWYSIFRSVACAGFITYMFVTSSAAIGSSQSPSQVMPHFHDVVSHLEPVSFTIETKAFALETS